MKAFNLYIEDENCVPSLPNHNPPTMQFILKTKTKKLQRTSILGKILETNIMK